MESSATVTARQEQLLFAVCRDYVLGGQPASSGRLVKAHGLPWSSATVRNELAALERIGLLERSHHSSGRLPTQAGMRRYIDSLPSGSRLSSSLATAVDHGLQGAGSVGEEVRAASRVLSEVAGCVAVSFVGSARTGRIRSVDIAPLVLPKALVVLGFDDGSRVMRPVSIEGLDPDASSHGGDLDRQLRRLQERLRSLCVDRTLERAMRELRALQRAQADRVDRALGEALRLGLVVCAGAALDPLWLQVAGQRTLAGGAALDTEALGDVLGLLEDYQRLAEVLSQLLPSEPEAHIARAQVRLGVPLGRPERANHGVRLTVVGCRVPLAQISPSTGLVALLGSDRMDYACAIPLVEYAARSLASHGES